VGFLYISFLTDDIPLALETEIYYDISPKLG